MNNNIKELYVSFEVAKLLQLNGFDVWTPYRYHMITGKVKPYDDIYSSIANDYIERPTQALAVEWLRVNFGIHIYTTPTLNGGKDKVKWRVVIYPCGVTNQRSSSADFLEEYNFDGNWWDSPQEAMEAALLYVLKEIL